MKNRLKIHLTVISIVAICLLTVACGDPVQQEIPRGWSWLTYNRTEGGYIVFNNTEWHYDPVYYELVNGYDSLPVEAVAYEGYEFVGWSDGVESATRVEKNVQNDVTVTALFEYRFSRYLLNYRGGECDNGMSEMTFYRNDFEQTKFPVPHKEHFTFDGWFIDDQRVTDANGNMVIGVEMTDVNSNEIRATWIANETFTYKILMVYVTEVNADLPNKKRDGTTVNVEFSMSEDERKLCGFITSTFETAMEKLLDGLIDFQIEEYFTEVPVGSDSFKVEVNLPGTQYENYFLSLFPSNIPEVAEMRKSYDSTLTVYSTSNHRDIVSSGRWCAATEASIDLDFLYDQVLDYGYTADVIIDAFEQNGGKDLHKDFAGLVISEIGWLANVFTNTVSLRDARLYPFTHVDLNEEVRNKYKKYNLYKGLNNNFNTNVIRTARDYLLCDTVIDGEKVGIPYEMWRYIENLRKNKSKSS